MQVSLIHLKSKFLLIQLILLPVLPATAISDSREDGLPGNRTEILIYNDSIEVHGPLILKEFPLNLISPASGVRFYKEGILYLSSTRNESGLPAKHLSFGKKNLYYSSFSDSTLGEIKRFSANEIMAIPAESVTFNADYTEMYFTRISPADRKEKIFYGRNSGQPDQWLMDNNPLFFCELNTVYSHPALSADGNILVFASEKEGSFSGLDLYYSRKDNQTWGKPEIMDASINSKGDEFFPFLDRENNLFFSSDGLPGYGGFDIYASRFNGSTWGAPVNLTKRINTNVDDIAFTQSRKEENTGFYSTGDTGGNLNLILLQTGENFRENGMMLSSLLFNLAIIDMDPEMQEKYTSQGQTKDAKREIQKEEISHKPETTQLPELQETKATIPEVSDKQQDKKTESGKTTPTIIEEVSQSDSGKLQVQREEPVIKKEEASKPGVIYRVQFASSSKEKGSYIIQVEGEPCNTWEYYYKGAYRSCAGEYDNLEDAKKMQTRLRQSGFTQAFVVVFVDNERSLDPALFR